MFLAHLWATEYVAPPELGITKQPLFYKYVAATRLGWRHSFRSFEAKPVRLLLKNADCLRGRLRPVI